MPIDRPATAAELAWNSAAVRAYSGSSCDVGDGDSYIDYTLGIATPKIISLSWVTWEYCHGTPHGFGGVVGQTNVLSPNLHELLPSDLFKDDPSWRERVAALALAAVQKEAKARGFEFVSSDEHRVAAVAQDSHRWLLRPEGLDIAFDPYELGAGYAFAPDILIPWSDLRPVLAQDAPLWDTETYSLGIKRSDRMGYVSVTVSPSGELVLPDSLRSSLHLEQGGTAILREEDGFLVVDSIESRVARAQALVRKYAAPGGSVVDELIAERRAEAARE